MEATPFLFGKLPAHGDFVVRGLSDAERDAWDDWGAAALSALRQAAGDDFEAMHGAAAPWRFVSGGAPRWTAGALAPSVDNVGRRFLVALGVSGLTPEMAGGCGLALAAAAEALIYDALAQGLSADAVIADARGRFAACCDDDQEAAAALAASPRGPGAWWSLGSVASGPVALSAGQAPPDLLVRGCATVSTAAVLM